MDYWTTIEPYLMKVIEVVIIIAIIFVFWKLKQAHDTWENYASRHGFKHLPYDTPRPFSERIAMSFQDPGEVQGKFHELPFRLSAAIHGSGKNRRVFTIMSVEIPHLPAGLAVYQENTLLKITKLFGAQDVKTGDSNFDAAFVVKGDDPASVSAWLNASRRSAILRVLDKKPDIDISGGCLRFERSQIVDDPEVLEEAMASFEALIPHLQSHQQ